MSRNPAHVPWSVDDDPKIRSGLAKHLTEQGVRVTAAADGHDMQLKLANAHIDLACSGRDDAGRGWMSICRRMATETKIPVVFLTAIAAETQIASIGLEIGAEDYVCKPFSPRELLARIRVVLRRKGAQALGTRKERGHAVRLCRLASRCSRPYTNVPVRCPRRSDNG